MSGLIQSQKNVKIRILLIAVYLPQNTEKPKVKGQKVMAKNENGYPCLRVALGCVPCASEGIVGGVTDTNRPNSNSVNQGGCPGGNGCIDCNGCGCGNSNGNGNGNGNGNAINNGSVGHNGCGGTGNCLDYKPLAYVYAPHQHFRLLYSAKDALSHGTLFEELYKPMEVYGRE